MCTLFWTSFGSSTTGTGGSSTTGTGGFSTTGTGGSTTMALGDSSSFWDGGCAGGGVAIRGIAPLIAASVFYRREIKNCNSILFHEN